MPKPSRRKKRDELVLLKDLMPKKDPKGGHGATVFGEHPEEVGQPLRPLPEETGDTRGEEPAPSGKRGRKTEPGK